jgi:hypothetical protein
MRGGGAKALRDRIAVAQDMAGTHKSSLGPRAASVAEQRDGIVAALDFLVPGV